MFFSHVMLVLTSFFFICSLKDSPHKDPAMLSAAKYSRNPDRATFAINPSWTRVPAVEVRQVFCFVVENHRRLFTRLLGGIPLRPMKETNERAALMQLNVVVDVGAFLIAKYVITERGVDWIFFFRERERERFTTLKLIATRRYRRALFNCTENWNWKLN